MFNEKLLRAKLILNDKTMQDLANALGIDSSTLSRKLKDNGRFNRTEITTIVSFLNLDSQTMTEIFFAEELA